MAIAGIPLVHAIDNATQSNYHAVASTHLEIEWDVNWDERILNGAVTHTFVAKEDNVSKIELDTSYLSIGNISTGTEILKYTLHPRHPNLGQKLEIALTTPLAKGDELVVKIAYATTKDCTAIGYLEAQQTASGKYPFLFSQCQAIHARSLLPCQDTPAIKATYDAAVASTLPILCSAQRISPSQDEQVPIDGKARTYTFKQPVAIPSYLIAIAGGELAFKALGKRTGVWAEPALLEASAWEFEEDIERFVETAESVASPYSWGRYDVLVLPNSFPYGGMENPNMTFLTPALVVGDRSEVDVVAHEASHSWFGNLIGCGNWSSFWLNESWTTYCERLISRQLFGEPARGFQYLVGREALVEDLKKQSSHPAYQRLHIPYEFGEDPDDGFSSVPYDLGGNLLLFLEGKVGGLEVWLPYVKAYVARFSGLSITTQDWLNHFWAYWEGTHPEIAARLRTEVDWDKWIHGEALDIPQEVKYDTSLADAAVALAARWDAARAKGGDYSSFSGKDIEGWRSTQVGYFLTQLRVKHKALPREAVEAAAKAYPLDGAKNPEIRFRWYLLALTSEAGLRTKEAAEWLATQGRMKYVRPVYRALFKVDKELAIANFRKHKGYYHPICGRIVAKDLGIEY